MALAAASRVTIPLISLAALRSSLFGLSEQALSVLQQPTVLPAAGSSPCVYQTGLLRRSSSTSTGTTLDSGDKEVSQRAQVNRLLYRAKQRGFLELDILVGNWAQEQVPTMGPAMLQAFTAVLHQENPDLFKWLTGQEGAPEELLRNPAYKALRDHVATQMAKHTVNVANAAPGASWVRGWDDWKRAPAK